VKDVKTTGMRSFNASLSSIANLATCLCCLRQPANNAVQTQTSTLDSRTLLPIQLLKRLVPWRN